MNSKTTKWILVSLLLGLAGVWLAAPARAQVSGATLSGTITDAQGGAVADAKVTAKNLATGVSVDTTTNTTGRVHDTQPDCGGLRSFGDGDGFQHHRVAGNAHRRSASRRWT